MKYILNKLGSILGAILWYCIITIKNLYPKSNLMSKAKFKERVRKIRALGFRSSSDLYAGMPMIYSCRLCGGIADTRPESYDPRDYPKTEEHCEACKKELKKHKQKELEAIVKEVEKEIPYHRDDTSGEDASRDWYYSMRRLSEPEVKEETK